MKRVLTSAILTFTLFTQPTYAQFAASGFANISAGGYGAPAYGGYGSGYGGYGAGQGVGYYPAMQGCPYNQGVAQGAFSGQDDATAEDRIQKQIDALQAKEDCLERGEDGSDDDDSDVPECKEFQKKTNINTLKADLRRLLPPDLFDIAITDHMEQLADCSCAAGAVYDQNAPGQRANPPVRAAAPGVRTNSMNDTTPGGQCLQFDTPDFVGQYPAAFSTADTSWLYTQPAAVKDLNYKALTVAKHTVDSNMDRAPAWDGQKKKKKKSSGNSNGDPQQGPTTPAPVATNPPAGTAPATPPAQACSPIPSQPAPPSSGSCPTAVWYPGVNGMMGCKDHGGVDARICTNEFNALVVDSSGHPLKHFNSDETTQCQNDLDELYTMIQKKKELKDEIAKLNKKEFEEEMGDGKKHKGRGGKGDEMEASSGGLSSTAKWGLIAGAATSVLGGALGYFGGRAAANEQCTMNAKLGYPCSGNNWGAVQAGIAGVGLGVPIMQAGLYAGAAAGGSGSCGGQATPYGMQPAYGMQGVPGQGGAFGYPQGYGPLSPFGQGGYGGIGAGALMPGMGYLSQGMANPYGSPFGPSQYGGIGGAYGGAPGISPFGGYGGAGAFGGLGSGAVMPYGVNSYGGYNPAAAQGELAYRLGYENPMGYAANAQSAQTLLQQAQIGVAQINGGYGGYGYGQYGAASPYAYGYPGYGGSGISAGFSLTAGYGGSAYSPYSLYGASYPNYNLGYGSSFSSLAPSTALSVFGTTGTTATSTTTTPFGR